MDGRRVDRRGDVFEAQREDSRGEANLAYVAYQRDVRVVNRDGDFGLVFFGSGQRFGFGGVGALRRLRRCSSGVTGQQERRESNR